MELVNVAFKIEEGGYEPFIIPSSSDVKIGEVIDKYKNKIKDVDFKDYEFYFNDKIINKDLKVSHFQLISANSKGPLIIIISVRKRSNITKCPDCCTNTCFLKIENFRLSYSGCPYNHKSIKSFAQYEDSQKINYEGIKCDKCSKTLKEVKECLNV